MRTPWRPVIRVSFASAVLALAAAPGYALEADTNVGFTATGISPWTGQPGYTVYEDKNIGVNFSVDIPTVGVSPSDILANFLGINASILSATVGGSASVKAGIDFGYYATDGRLSLSYPGLAQLNIATVPGTNLVSGAGFGIDTSFGAGLTKPFIPLVSLSALAGAGYGDNSIPGFFGGAVFRDPHFGTTFPNVSAWADLYVDADLSAFVEAKGLDLPVFGCVACVRKDFSVATGNHVIPIVEIDPSNVIVAGLGGIQLNQPFAIPPATTITPSYPNLKVAGTLTPGTTIVAGSDSKPFVTLQGNIDDLIPFVGPFLSGAIGPFGYDLASLEGGPSVGLYQNLSFTVTPRVQLDFSEPVKVSVAGGAYSLVTSTTFDLGQSIDVKPLISSFGDLKISPTYYLDNKFVNETGLSLDVTFDVTGPELTSSFGDLGPLGHQTATLNLAQFPISTTDFSVPVNPITARTVDLQKTLLAGSLGSQIALQSFNVLDLDTTTGAETVQLNFLDHVSGWTGSATVVGTETPLSLLNGQLLDRVFSTPDDIILSLPGNNPLLEQIVHYDAGNSFCLGCVDLGQFFNGLNPVISDGDDDLFISKLLDLPDDYCLACDPILSQQNIFASGPDPTVLVGPTVPFQEAPEPPAWTLLLAGLGGMSLITLRKVRAGMT